MQKKKFVIFILVLTILLFGASTLYKTLSDIKLSFNLYPLGPEEDMNNSDIPVE